MKEKQKAIVFKTFFRLLKIMPDSFRLRAILSFVFLFVNSALDIAGLGAVIPLILIVLEKNAFENYPSLQKAYDLSGVDSQLHFILLLSGAIILLIILKNLFSLMIHYYQARFSYGLQRHFSSRLYRAYYDKGFLYFKGLNSANIVRNIQAVPTAFAANILLPMMTILNEIVMITFILVGLLLYEPKVVLLLLAIVGPTFLIFYQSTRKLTRRIAETQHKISPYLTKNIVESVYGYIDVEVTATNEQFFKRHERYQAEIMGLLTKGQVLKILPNKILETSLILGVLVLMVYGVIAFDQRGSLIALLGVFALSAYRVMPSVNRILTGLISLNGFRYTLDLIEKELMTDQKGTNFQSRKSDPISFKENIVCEQVGFTYPNKSLSVLKSLDIEIKKGKVVGFVGKSGSGKSTLMNLLLGFLTPTDGTIKVDGKVIDEQHAAAWRQHVGYVQQEVYLTDGTIRENVAFGQDESTIDDQKVMKCLELASLGEFIKDQEKGIYGKVGERGGLLSGGQKQRVGIARALYSGAEVLFFDEATSALDNDTEREVTEAIHRLQQEDLTMLIIAHRITTLKFCDHIYEMEEGKLKGEVTYQELVEKTVYN